MASNEREGYARVWGSHPPLRLDRDSLDEAAQRAAAGMEIGVDAGSLSFPAGDKSVLGADGEARKGVMLERMQRLDPFEIEKAFGAYARGEINSARARECALLWARGLAFDLPPGEAD